MPPEGRGFSADDLYDRQVRDMKERLDKGFPALKAEALEVVLAHRRATDRLEELKLKLQGHVGGDNVRLALDLLGREADQIVKAEARTVREPVFAAAEKSKTPRGKA